ncbi:MAG: hypothetical protein PHP08_04670 [Candidatus Dojkabacteria bacterium]|nr:hypothetical protein [Candidatus Dojkabacteria bacterium]
MSSVDCRIPIVFSDNEYIKEVIRTKHILYTNRSFIKKIFYCLLNRIYSKYKILIHDFDIFQPTDPYPPPFLKGESFVLVVLDITHEIFPEIVSSKDRTIVWKKEFDLELPKEYILFVGNREKYKNFDSLIKTIVSLLREKICFLCVQGV